MDVLRQVTTMFRGARAGWDGGCVCPLKVQTSKVFRGHAPSGKFECFARFVYSQNINCASYYNGVISGDVT